MNGLSFKACHLLRSKMCMSSSMTGYSKMSGIGQMESIFYANIWARDKETHTLKDRRTQIDFYILNSMLVIVCKNSKLDELSVWLYTSGQTSVLVSLKTFLNFHRNIVNLKIIKRGEGVEPFYLYGPCPEQRTNRNNQIT